MTSFSDDQFPAERQIERELRSAHESRGGVAAALAYLEEANLGYKSIEINIAVLGEMKVGKSTLINSIRGLNGDDEGAAEVGVTQTTMEPEAYPHPNNPKLIFWDLPGAGSIKFPAASYLEQMKAEKFDFFLLVTDTAFKEIYKDFALRIKAMGKGMIFVRTKVDVAVSADEQVHPRTHNKKRVLDKIREEIIVELNDPELSSKVFLINNHNRNDYDYPDFWDFFVTDFPKMKRSALILSLDALNDRMVDKKVEIISKDIPKLMIVSGITGLIPIPFMSAALDFAMMGKAIKSFTEKMGLDAASIERLIKEYPEREVELRKVIKESGISQFNSLQGLQTFIKTISPALLMEEAKEVTRLLPPVGWLVASGLSVALTRRILWAALKQLQCTAKRALHAATGKILDVPLEEAPLNNPDFVIEQQMLEQSSG